MEKEFIPFKARRGLTVWPDGKTLAVAIYVAFEEWDDDAEGAFSFPPPIGPPMLPHMKKPDLAIRSTIEYGHRVGIWRILEILDRHSVTVTIVGNGLAADRHPDMFKQFASLGFDIVAHGYDQNRFFTQLTVEEQADDIDRCIKAFQKATGTKVLGWGSPGARQYQPTLDLLAERGFAFHQGLHDDELPYLLHFGKRTMVEVPYRLTESGEPTDVWMYTPSDNFVGDDAIAYCRAIIDARYRDSAVRPQMLVIGNHPDVVGRPDRAEILSKVISYLKTLPNVWLTTIGSIAEHWRETAPSLPVQFVREKH